MIETAYFELAKLGRGALSAFTVIEATLLSKKIIPCAWVEPNDSEQRCSFLQWQSFSISREWALR